MPVINIERALEHLRENDDAGNDVLLKLESATDIAEQFLNRKVFESSGALQIARTNNSILIANAQESYNQSIAVADLTTDYDYKKLLRDTVQINKTAAMREVRMIELGVVINPSIEIGILMLLGHLYANREDIVVGFSVSEIPKSSEAWLSPYRIDLGV